jgi:hypothetical protein
MSKDTSTFDVANDEKKVATDEEVVQGLQTAAGFAENIVKKMFSIGLHKELDELFGDELIDHVGVIKLEPKPDTDTCGYTLKLDIVPATYKVDVNQFKTKPYVFDEMVRLLTACETYWQFCKKTYNLPNISLWRSNHGTLYISGAPATMSHIGIRVSTF